ncbi:MAG: glycerophosphodiester phosphodiesterase [Candidatus Thorarchaeota archaeon]
MKPYIFGHRGASGYEIENTFPAFNKAVSMGAGIETDVQLTKDKKLICFHDPYIKIKDKQFYIKDLTLKEIKKIKFSDGRNIPLIEDVFSNFKENQKKFRYSIDIIDLNSGIELLSLVGNISLRKKLEITDQRLLVLSSLKKKYESANLVYTLPLLIDKINEKSVDLHKLREIGINVINIKNRRNIEEYFKDTIDNGFKCYIWGVNTRANMKKIINLRYKDEIVNAIFTDYPDRLLNLIMEHFK